jgi:hypothetical protein
LRVYNRYLLSLILASCLIDVFFAFQKQTDISVCFTVLVIVYLLITILFIYLSPQTRKILSMMSVVFSAGFGVIVILKVLEVLGLK